MLSVYYFIIYLADNYVEKYIKLFRKGEEV